MLRLIRRIATAGITVLAAAWGTAWVAGWLPPMAQAVAPPPIGASLDFSLVDTAGRNVTDASFRGQWMLIYFAYTDCPDTCPAVLQDMSAALDQLPRSDIVPVMMTLDPGRDTTDVLAQYTALFDPRLVGLTGTPGQVDAAMATFHVIRKVIPSNVTRGYMFEHSRFVYLEGPDGTLRAIVPPGAGAAGMARTIATAMAKGGQRKT